MEPYITEWLMVGITAVYVVATIFICLANLKSAKASKEQLTEMKLQYAEDNRPRIEVEFCYKQRTWYIARFVNHGKHTAQHVQVLLNQEFIDSLPNKTLREVLEKQREKEAIIGANQHYDLYIAGNELRGNPNMKPLKGKVKYQDDRIQYENDIFIDLKNYMTFFSSTGDEDNLIKAVKNNTEEIKGIKLAIQKMILKEKDNKNV